MTKIVLVRHGHVEGIAPPRFRGGTDLPLTAFGRAQAMAVAARIAEGWKPTMIYTSPLQRCIATAEPIAAACRIGYGEMPELKDFDYGELQGRTHDEVRAAAPAFFTAWNTAPQFVRFPGGESLQDLAARTADVLRFVIERHRAEPIVLVAHDSTNRTLLLQCLDLPLSAYWRIVQEPCAISEIDIIDGCVRILRMNETHHLKDIALP
jgi:broad specificity phosphatase PhoE